MLGKLDRYVGSAALSAYVLALLFFGFMSVLFDVLLEMDKYTSAAEENDIGTFALLGMLGKFHLLSLPSLFVTIAPFVTVIASMFAVTRFMASNEVTPMIFTGRSMFRTLLPVMALGLFSALAMALMWQTMIPYVSEQRESLQLMLKGDPAEVMQKRVMLWSRDNPRQMLFCERYVHSKELMENVVLYDPGSTAGDELLVQAKSATWNPEKKDWELLGGLRKGKAGRSDPEQYLGLSEVTPTIIRQSRKLDKEASGLSYTELQELRRMRPGKSSYTLALHSHVTFPLANLVLMLLALPLAVHFERGRRIERVALAIVICAGYLLLDLTCQNLGHQGYLHAVVAAWTPTIIFGSLGVVVYSGMRT